MPYFFVTRGGKKGSPTENTQFFKSKNTYPYFSAHSCFFNISKIPAASWLLPKTAAKNRHGTARHIAARHENNGTKRQRAKQQRQDKAVTAQYFIISA